VLTRPTAGPLLYDRPVTDYTRLGTHLASRTESSVTLTLDAVDVILGDLLPLAARVLPGWWTSTMRRRHPQACGWLDVGWQVDDFDAYAETVTFVRESAE
jgi:hypothetical protein